MDWRMRISDARLPGAARADKRECDKSESLEVWKSESLEVWNGISLLSALFDFQIFNVYLSF